MEARRWHVVDYETVLPELDADRLEVCVLCMPGGVVCESAMACWLRVHKPARPIGEPATHPPPSTSTHAQAFFPRLLSRCQVEMLAAGNLDAAAATQFAQHLEAALRER